MVVLTVKRIQHDIDELVAELSSTIFFGGMKFIAPKIKSVEIFTQKSGTKHTTWGWCHINEDHTFTIKLNSMLADANRSGYMSVLTHELIHTQPGCFNHGTTFKWWCHQIMNLHPELTLQRCESFEEIGFDSDIIENHKEQVKLSAKYTFICSRCGHQYFYQRRPKWYLTSGKVNAVCGCSGCKGELFCE